MADAKTSALPAAAAALGAMEIPVNAAGTSKKVTIAQVKTALQDGGDAELSLVGLTGFFPMQVAVLAADGTNSTATMASTGLSVPVTLNRKYKFELEFHFSESVAPDGLAVDFGGGSAAATNFRAGAILSDAGLDSLTAGQTSGALATDIVAQTADDGVLLVKGCFEPSSSGTFIPRYAQAAHTIGTLTIKRGSMLTTWDVT